MYPQLAGFETTCLTHSWLLLTDPPEIWPRLSVHPSQLFGAAQYLSIPFFLFLLQPTFVGKFVLLEIKNPALNTHTFGSASLVTLTWGCCARGVLY